MAKKKKKKTYILVFYWEISQKSKGPLSNVKDPKENNLYHKLTDAEENS